jgi:mutator protein MutT
METLQIAKALIIDANNDVLIMYRSKTHPTLALQADLPGGLVEPGETPSEGLVREVLEETGLTVTPGDLKLAYTATNAWEDKSFIRFLYIIKLREAKPTTAISWEHDRTTWLPVSQLPDIEHEYHYFYRDALEYLNKNDILANL